MTPQAGLVADTCVNIRQTARRCPFFRVNHSANSCGVPSQAARGKTRSLIENGELWCRAEIVRGRRCESIAAQPTPTRQTGIRPDGLERRARCPSTAQLASHKARKRLCRAVGLQCGRNAPSTTLNKMPENLFTLRGLSASPKGPKGPRESPGERFAFGHPSSRSASTIGQRPPTSSGRRLAARFDSDVDRRRVFVIVVP